MTSEQRYRAFWKTLGYKPTLSQHRACLYLIRHGRNWFTDFQMTNAVEKAKALRAELKLKTTKKATRQRASVPRGMTKTNALDAL